MTITTRQQWRDARLAAYRAGDYTMKPPPVPAFWSEMAWCNWVRFTNPELWGFDDGK